MPDCHFNLGRALTFAGRPDEAIAHYKHALLLRPDYPASHLNLGVALASIGRTDEAITSYHRALSLRPDFAGAYNNLGAAHADKCDWTEAIGFFRRAIALKPEYLVAKNSLGNALSENGQVEEGIAILRHILTFNPDYAEAHFNLGNALSKKDQWEEAEPCFRRATELNPNYVRALNNLGNALLHLGRFDEALACCKRTLTLRPDLPEAHVNSGCAQMYLQHYREGWQELEWRLRCPTLFGNRRNVAATQWDGTSAVGQTILLRAEQGYGDTIQFLRFVPLVRERTSAAQIILECPSPLVRIVRLSAGLNLDVVTRQGADDRGLPPFERHIPLPSLPFALGLYEPLPMSAPYLQADPEQRTIWRARLGPRENFRVGLAWAGNPENPQDRRRSIPQESLMPLLCVPGVKIYSLQVGSRPGSQRAIEGLGMLDLTTHITDFADTAALIAELELVISADTAVAHLAGALGKPVWTLLPFVPDWRWELEREHTPWYPTMRLFRQFTMGDWDSVLQRAAEALAANFQ